MLEGGVGRMVLEEGCWKRGVSASKFFLPRVAAVNVVTFTATATSGIPPLLLLPPPPIFFYSYYQLRFIITTATGTTVTSIIIVARFEALEIRFTVILVFI